MNKIEKVLYVASATSSGGRDGVASTSDGKLNLKLSTPREMGGPGGEGTNPEQLFAVGYSACFLGAVKFAAGKLKVALPADTTITGNVGFGVLPVGFGINAELVASMPGLDRAVAQSVLDLAHQVCPYSNATRGNIEVIVRLA